MTIAILDNDLEQKLERLGKRQAVPVKKTSMALAILREAVRDDRGKPVEKWKGTARQFSD